MVSFSGPLEGWEPVYSPAKGLDSNGAPLEKPDRVAQEFSKVVKKYVSDADSATESSSEHATLMRVKKKGSWIPTSARRRSYCKEIRSSARKGNL